MNDLIYKYFRGELTDEEKHNFLICIERNPALKEEFIEIQNLLGITGFLPHKEDMPRAEESLSKFMEHIRKTGKLI